jgi:hypothetical protein
MNTKKVADGMMKPTPSYYGWRGYEAAVQDSRAGGRIHKSVWERGIGDDRLESTFMVSIEIGTSTLW